MAAVPFALLAAVSSDAQPKAVSAEPQRGQSPPRMGLLHLRDKGVTEVPFDHKFRDGDKVRFIVRARFACRVFLYSGRGDKQQLLWPSSGQDPTDKNLLLQPGSIMVPPKPRYLTLNAGSPTDITLAVVPYKQRVRYHVRGVTLSPGSMDSRMDSKLRKTQCGSTPCFARLFSLTVSRARTAEP